MATRKKTRRAAPRRPKRRRVTRRNPVTVSTRVRKNPARRRTYRRNPLLPGKAVTQMLIVAAGFLGAPMIANLIPFQPVSKFGEYIKKGIGVGVGSMVIGAVMGKRFGNALMLGGAISIGVDVLRDFVPAFAGGGATGDGVSAYFPPDSELFPGQGQVNNSPAAGMLPESAGVPGRWGSRYYLPAGVA